MDDDSGSSQAGQREAVPREAERARGYAVAEHPGPDGIARPQADGLEGAAPSSLVSDGNILAREQGWDWHESKVVKVDYVAAPCRCRDQFCGECQEKHGRDLWHKLIKGWSNAEAANLKMITLTYDPTLFQTHRDAWEFIRGTQDGSSKIGLLMQRLKRHRLITGRYSWVVETHQDGRVHYHVLVETPGGFLDKHVVQDLWGRYRPKNAGPVVDGRPSFGLVWISSADRGKGLKFVVNYCAKYVSKSPVHGIPDWILDLPVGVKFRRYSCSLGFDGKKKPERKSDEPGQPRPMKRTRRQRLQDCGEKADIFRREHLVWMGGRGIQAEYMGRAAEPMADVRARFSAPAASPDKLVLLSHANAERLVKGGAIAKSPRPSEGGEVHQINGGESPRKPQFEGPREGGEEDELRRTSWEAESGEVCPDTPPAFQDFESVVKFC